MVEESVVTNPLLDLAKALQLSDITLRKVHETGCESPAEWKFAVLECPQEPDEAKLWEAVQEYRGTDPGAIGALARAHVVVQAPKVKGSTTSARPKTQATFRETRKIVQQKMVGNSKRKSAASALAKLL